MTASSWMQRFIALVHRHVDQMATGEITEAQANRELAEMTWSAQLEMTDEEFDEFLSRVLVMDHAASALLSAEGHPVPGNDPNKPN
jgi:hypothetical protein